MQKISRRKVQIVLGSLWLLDGLLQLQPKMFTSNFATQVIEPAQSGQPFYLYDPIHLAIKIFLFHPAVFNSFIAIIQISLGLLILFKRTTRYSLWLSVAWGSFVWYIGEAATGMFSGHSVLLMGLPGAALLYAIIALGVLPKKDDKKQVADYWLVFVWVAVWLAGAIFQLLPGQNSVSDLAVMINGNANGAPGWMASLDTHVASAINGFGATTTSMTGLHMTASQMAQMSTQPGSGYWFILLLVVLQLCIGIGVLFRNYWRKAAIAVGIVLSLVFWVVGQQLGGYYTGVMTDVQTAPLLILLGIAIIGQPDMGLKLKKAYSRLEKALV